MQRTWRLRRSRFRAKGGSHPDVHRRDGTQALRRSAPSMVKSTSSSLGCINPMDGAGV